MDRAGSVSNRSLPVWISLLGKIHPLSLRVVVLRIVWFDYICHLPDAPYPFLPALMYRELGDYVPPPAVLERELLKLGYPAKRAAKRARV